LDQFSYLIWPFSVITDYKYPLEVSFALLFIYQLNIFAEYLQELYISKILKYKRTCTIFYLSRNLSRILFTLHYLLQSLKEMKLLVLLFIQIGFRWSDFYRVMCFIHSKLYRLCFAFRRDIVDYKDIQILFFFNRKRCQFLINVYFNRLCTAMDFLSNKALNISNLLYIGGDFNVIDCKKTLSFT